jgi:hypothetical protein
MHAVDIDRAESWPSSVASAAERWARALPRKATSASDLVVPADAEAELAQLLAGCGLRAYHATRLLPFEADQIALDGLAPLTGDLVARRIAQAIAHGALSAAEGAVLLSQNVFAMGEAAHRAGQVCFALSESVVRRGRFTFGDILTYWGGEAMFKASYEPRPILARLGVPTIVVALLAVSPPSGRHRFFPSLPQCFVGAHLKIKDYSADVFFRSPVPPNCIERIAQPGDPWYDQFRDLPQA